VNPDEESGRSQGFRTLGTLLGTLAWVSAPSLRRHPSRPPEHARSERSVVHDPRADFNFREHGARVLSLEVLGPAGGRARGGEGSPEMESQATNYGEGG